MTEVLVNLEALSVGDQVGPYRRTTSAVQLFRFSAETFNPHRIHYDRDYAATEGHRERLVQAHLLGAFLATAGTAWAGPRGRLSKLGWLNRAPAYVGEELHISATISAKRSEAGRMMIELEVRLTGPENRVCVQGTMEISY